jgi:hypothetical protein
MRAHPDLVEHGTCSECRGPILFAPTVGSGFCRPVWTHLRREDWESNAHPARPVGRGVSGSTTDTVAGGIASNPARRIDRSGSAVPTTNDVQTLIVEAEQP